MKKIILTVLSALLLAVPAVHAQKVNKTALIAAIEKSDAEITDAKKNTKSATWINRGKAFYNAAAEPTKGLYVGMEASLLKLVLSGDTPTMEKAKLPSGAEADAYVYSYVTIYVVDGKIVAWNQTKFVQADAIARAIEAYTKAFEVDPKAAPKIKEGLKQISDFCSQAGNVGIDSGNFATAAAAYLQAYDAQSVPAYGAADPSLLYYAGYLLTFDGATNPGSFAEGAKVLNAALQAGYADEEGMIYYYLFHCYYGQKDLDKENITKAKNILLAGIEKFPKNERIIESLVQLYTSPDDNVGDPADLIALIDKAISDSPDNADLWFGRGRIYFALKNSDEALNSFLKVAELRPDQFDSNYYVGLFYTMKADDMNKTMNEKSYSSQKAYDADLALVNEVYMQAIPWFEKALSIKPDDFSTLDYLKSLAFRLRDEPGMQEKYDKYYPMWQAARDKQ